MIEGNMFIHHKSGQIQLILVVVSKAHSTVSDCLNALINHECHPMSLFCMNYGAKLADIDYTLFEFWK